MLQVAVLALPPLPIRRDHRHPHEPYLWGIPPLAIDAYKVSNPGQLLGERRLLQACAWWGGLTALLDFMIYAYGLYLPLTQ